MAIRAKRLITADQAPDSSAAVYTAGDNTRTQITRAIAYNDDSSGRTLTLYQVPSGGTANADTKVKTWTILAGETEVLHEMIGARLNESDAIHWVADVADKVNLHLDGQEYS